MKYLDDNIIPILYKIYFKININNSVFTGSNNIQLQIIKPTNQIQFHAKNLIINKKTLTVDKANIIDILFDTINDIYVIKLDTILQIGYYNLLIDFSGKTTSNDGLIRYLHKLTNRLCIYSRFEPISARKCYPCWDEPKYRVKYQTSIEINDQSFIVLFNTDPEKIQLLDNNCVLYQFFETIPMSTYVNSFIISRFTYLESISKHNIRLRVYIPTDIINKTCGDFALECGIKMLDFMIDYCGISFPYNKIDFIPINDTTAQGMENYGLIFYNLECLLFDINTTTLEQRISIAHVIAHEIAHQWFGNLISINEWNNIWLKESFARFFQYIIVDNIFPQWDTTSLNIVNICKTLDYDSFCLKSVHVKHIHKEDIRNIYSKLTYDKGGLLLNILLKYIGEKQFKINIQKYLQNYKHNIVNNNSFIDSICDNLNHNMQHYIRQLITQYITINGFPIIKCINNKIDFESFNCINIIKNHITKNNSYYKSKLIDWYIPLNTVDNKYMIFNNLNMDRFLPQNKIINNKNYSYFRINYNEEQFKSIINNIHNDTSHQHLSIINDLYTLGIYLICPFEYYLLYVNKLINLLLKIDDNKLYNFYLIDMIYSNIKHINKFNKFNNKIIERLLIIPIDRLINRLNKLFDIYNIELYTNKDKLLTTDINHSLIIFFLLNIKSTKSTKFINEMFDRKLFNLYGDLNKIIINRIISNNDVSRLNQFIQVIIDYPHMYSIIKDLLPKIQNKKIIDIIFHDIISEKSYIDYSYIIEMLDNKYFLNIFTVYFINNIESNMSIYSDNIAEFHKLLKQLFINQTDYDLIIKLLNKFKKIKDIDIVEYKYTLFNKLYTNFIILKFINNLK